MRSDERVGVVGVAVPLRLHYSPTGEMSPTRAVMLLCACCQLLLLAVATSETQSGDAADAAPPPTIQSQVCGRLQQWP